MMLSAGQLLWESNPIHEDPVIFIDRGDAIPPWGKLLTIPEKIISATNSDASIMYKEGIDFTIDYQTGKVYLPPGSKIITLKASELYPPKGAPNSLEKKKNSDRNMLAARGSFLPDRQVRFTYTHGQKNLPQPPKVRYGAMPRLEAKLAEGKPIHFLIFGDSISAGWNSSKKVGIPPYQIPQFEQFADFLQKTYGVEVTCENFAVPGRNAHWGLNHIDSPLNAQKVPDFVILAWGMNDVAAGFKISTYAEVLKGQMQKFREKFPDIEFLLLTSMPSNEEWSYTKMDLFTAYSNVTVKLADKNGVLVADATPIWMKIVAIKGFMSLTGNGLNHPNDFGHRIYADVLIDAIQKR